MLERKKEFEEIKLFVKNLLQDLPLEHQTFFLPNEKKCAFCCKIINNNNAKKNSIKQNIVAFASDDCGEGVKGNGKFITFVHLQYNFWVDLP